MNLAPESLDGLLWTLVIAGVVAFLAVEAGVAWFAFRRPAGTVRSPRRLEAAWMLTPALILVGLVGWSAHVLGRDAGADDGEPEVTVHVTGRGFAWKVAYEVTGAGGETRLVDAGFNRIHLPAGRSARVVLTSEDVVHGFWVPQLRVKQDAIPGQSVSVRVRPLETGELNIVCATLCGDQHYAMRGFVHVESAKDFDAWLAKQEEG